jgi:hypothetical protein
MPEDSGRTAVVNAALDDIAWNLFNLYSARQSIQVANAVPPNECMRLN